MFIEVTDLCNNKVYININTIHRVEPTQNGCVVFDTLRHATSYKESYEEVRNMIDNLTAPKIFMPPCGEVVDEY